MFMKLISSFGRRLALYEDLASMTLHVVSGAEAGSELQGGGRAVGVGLEQGDQLQYGTVQWACPHSLNGPWSEAGS